MWTGSKIEINCEKNSNFRRSICQSLKLYCQLAQMDSEYKELLFCFFPSLMQTSFQKIIHCSCNCCHLGVIFKPAFQFSTTGGHCYASWTCTVLLLAFSWLKKEKKKEKETKAHYWHWKQWVQWNLEHASDDKHTQGKVALAKFFKLCTINIVIVFWVVFWGCPQSVCFRPLLLRWKNANQMAAIT